MDTGDATSMYDSETVSGGLCDIGACRHHRVEMSVDN